ncbi:hypothetical protein [Streptomyces sp. NPDC014734]|uniref:hypothetical protein n=1 Tax=Streptomyces sp. NPDC014734 TaxID=3364886 RepID=UPI0036FBD98E
MYAPGHPPTPPRRVPSRAWTVSMRVLFTVLSVGSFGLLLWSPLLRLAVVRRRALDTWLAGAGFVFVCVLLPVLGREGDDEPTALDGVLIALLLLTTAASLAYYFVGDVRHHERLAAQHLAAQHLAGGYPPRSAGHAHMYATTMPMRPSAPAPAPASGPMPGPAPVPQPPSYGPAPAMGQPAAPPSRPGTPPHPPSPSSPPPQRIEQVRAELDELSAYLRKEEGR